MKKIILLFIPVLMLASCQDEEYKPDNNKYPEPFYAEMEKGDKTKTSIDKNLNLLWQRNDNVVTFMSDGSKCKYKIEDAAAGKSYGRFDPVPGEGQEITPGAKAIVAYYPYSESAELTGNESEGYTIKNVEFPAVQQYSKYDLPNFPMISILDENNNASFKNICGILEIQLKAEPSTGKTVKVRSIRIKSNNNEIICGHADVKYKSGESPEVTWTSNLGTTIDLDCMDINGDGITLYSNSTTLFRIVLPPIEFSKGFKIEICASEINKVFNSDIKYMNKSRNSKIKTERSKITKMQTLLFKADDKPDSFVDEKLKEYAKKNGFEDRPNMEMIRIKVKGGTFKMGESSSDKDAYKDEFPAHDVSLTDYYMSECEVNRLIWGIVTSPDNKDISAKDEPITDITWEDINNIFIPKLREITGKDYRLPTEAEWEYAAEGGEHKTNNKYSGRSNFFAFPPLCSKDGMSDVNFTSYFGQTIYEAKNELGLYFMSGNAWEWCSDYYGPYTDSAVNNPTGPESGPGHVIRGGCGIILKMDNDEEAKYQPAWECKFDPEKGLEENPQYGRPENCCRNTNRHYLEPTEKLPAGETNSYGGTLVDPRYHYVGFRLVCPVEK